MYSLLAVLASLLSLGRAQQAGTYQAEVHPNLTWQSCSTKDSCTTINGSVALDANWRWAHVIGQTANCYTGNTWNYTACVTNADCAANCALEGAQYSTSYGITTSGNSIRLKFRTYQDFSYNFGSRVYLMASDTKYQTFTPNGNEIAFDVENDSIDCGLNGALYLVNMDEDGGMAKYPSNKVGARYGTGYCDSQCARDLKWIAGKGNAEGWKPSDKDPNAGAGNMGACCPEMDIWQSNKISYAMAAHPCQTSGYSVCQTTGCGGRYSDDFYAGACDPDGCDLNPFRHGNTDFYGSGKILDTSKKFTVVTQFIGSSNSLTGINQYFIQNGVKITVPASKYVSGESVITSEFCDAAKTVFKENRKFQDVGGLSQMGQATGKPMVLVMSLLDDAYASMLWLDGIRYPPERDASEPGVPRGECILDGSSLPAEVRELQRSAQITFSNIKFGPIGSTY